MHGKKIEKNRLWRNAQYSAQHSAEISPNPLWFYRHAIKPELGIHHLAIVARAAEEKVLPYPFRRGFYFMP